VGRARVKPAAIRLNRTLQAIDPAALPVEALLEHLERCREHLKEMIYQHMRFTVSCYEEMRSLIRHGQGPAAAELAERAKYRASHTAAGAPGRLGPEPAGPPPLDKLPREAVRAVRAIQTFVGALFRESDAPNEPLQQGDVLVTLASDDPLDNNGARVTTRCPWSRMSSSSCSYSSGAISGKRNAAGCFV
jgi:hypothetical protein